MFAQSTVEIIINVLLICAVNGVQFNVSSVDECNSYQQTASYPQNITHTADYIDIVY